MDIRQLQYVLALARNKNFTKTANELFITQPSLSSQISMIEEELGVKLFERSTRSVSLTPAGKTFCELGEKVIADWDEMIGSVGQFIKTPVSTFSIGLSFRGQCSEVVDHCISFFSGHSECKVTYLSKDDAEILEAVRSGSIDAGICRVDSTFVKKNIQKPLRTLPLTREASYFIMSPDHSLAQRSVLSLKDLQDQTLIVGLDGSAADQGLKNQARKLKLRPFSVIRANGSSMTVQLLKDGRGIIIGPRSIADYYGLAAVPSDTEEYGQLGLIYSTESEQPLMKDLINYLKEKTENNKF